MIVTVKISGLDQMIQQVEKITPASELAASQAINKALPATRSYAIGLMTQQLNFPAGYFGNANDREARLSISKYANSQDLEGSITGRDRPTSLARFVRSVGRDGHNPALAVKYGGANKTLKRAFIINLSSGNRGLAIRLPVGRRPRDAYHPVELGSGLWLLYGPSVNQAFKHVINDPEYLPGIENKVTTVFSGEWTRLMGLNR